MQSSIKQNTLAFDASKNELQAKETLTLNVILNYLQVLNNDLLVNTITRHWCQGTDRLDVLVACRGPYLLADLKGQHERPDCDHQCTELT